MVKFGFRVSSQKVTENRSNLIADRGESSLLIALSVDNFPFAGEPVGFLVREGRVFGAGALNLKGHVAILLVALFLSRSPVKVVFVVGGEGEKESAQTLKDEAEEAIVFKSTNLILEALEDNVSKEKVFLKIDKVLLPFELDKKGWVGRLVEKSWRDAKAFVAPGLFTQARAKLLDSLPRERPQLFLGQEIQPFLALKEKEWLWRKLRN